VRHPWAGEASVAFQWFGGAAFCSFTQVMERAAATSSSHWYLSACSKEENADESGAGADEWQPVAPLTIPSIPMIPRVKGPNRIRYPPKSAGFPLGVFPLIRREEILVNLI
jgi:hypothetical protein